LVLVKNRGQLQPANSIFHVATQFYRKLIIGDKHHVLY